MLILLMVPFLAVFFRRISGVSSIEGGRGVGKIIFVFTFLLFVWEGSFFWLA